MVKQEDRNELLKDEKDFGEGCIDVPVLIMFFNNDFRLKKVFNQVKKAKPSSLLLFQDGAREHSDDISGIKKCREIVENVDWDCNIHKLYLESNVGGIRGEYEAIKWAFSIVDKCVILEDDDIPSISFFKFCKELLDKYAFDNRIYMIAGMNHEGITEDVEEDYFFSESYSIWGWATWRRVVEQWDSTYSYFKNKTVIKELKQKFRHSLYPKEAWALFKKHYRNQTIHIDAVAWSNMILNSGLSIVPKYNLICNIGCDGQGVSTSTVLEEMPKEIRKLYHMKTFELEFPLKDPQYIMENVSYMKKVNSILAWNSPVKFYYRNMIKLLLILKNRGLLNTGIFIKERMKKKWQSKIKVNRTI